MAEPIYDEDKKPDSLAPESIKKQEQAADADSNEPSARAEHEHQVGRGYQHSEPASSKLARRFTDRRKILAGGGIAGLIIAIIIFFLGLLPLKLLHIVQNLENRFSATSQNALSKESEKLFSTYVAKHLAPGLRGSCTSTKIDRSCVAPITGTGPVAKLYDGWRQGRIENKLYEKYGIEIARGSDNRLRILSRDLPRAGVDISDIETNPARNIFDEPGLKTGEFRAKFREAFANETRFKQTYLLFKYGKFLETKYGHKRCLVGCNLKDRTTDKINDKKIAGKAWIVRRIIEPRSEMMSLVIQCVLNGGCDLNIDQNNKGSDGAPQSKFEADLREKLAVYQAQFGEDALKQIADEARVVQEKGFQRYIIEAVLSKAFGTSISAETKEALASSVPLAGWINRVINTADFLQNSGSEIKKMTYIVNSTTMVAAFGVYATAAHEMKAGDTDSAELGSLTTTLNSSMDGPGAEASPLYATLIDHKPPAAATAAAGSPFAGIAHAAAATVDKTKVYTCNDGNPVESGKLVCPEERLDAKTTAGETLNSVSSFLNLPVLGGTLKVVITIWKNTVGGLLGAVGGILGNITNALIPGSVKDAISSAIEPFVKFLTGQLVPSIVSSDSSGARMFNIAAGGADVSFNDSAHHLLGGKKLSDTEVATILNDQLGRDKAEFDSKPLYAKVFDTKDSQSMIARLSLSLPSDGSIASMLPKLPLNPFHAFHFAHASAASTSTFEDPFAVSQYGYPEDDPIFKADPEQYWNDNCADGTKTDRWYASSVENHNTGQAENTDTNPCLLLQGASDSAGALYPGGLVESNQNGAGQTATPTTPTTAGATIDLANLTKPSVDVACAPQTRDLGIQDGYTGGALVKIRICALPNLPSSSEESNGGFGVSGANGQAIVNSRVSGAFFALVEAAKAAKIPMSATSSFRTMAHQTELCNANTACVNGDYTAVAKPGTSNHQLGAAIDFVIPGLSNTRSACNTIAGRCTAKGNVVWEWLDNNAQSFGIKPYVNEFWHWSPTGN